MKPTSTHWADINEASFVAGMRFLFLIYRVFGRWPFRVVLYPILFWYVLTKPAARRASQTYLQRVTQYVTGVHTGWLGVMRHFATFAESILDKMLLWGGLFKTDDVDYQGMAQMDALLHEKRGALLICAHLGNLELCRVLSQQHDKLRLTILVHTKHARAFNRMLAALNPDSSLNLMQVTEMTPHTAIMLSEKIAQGEFVVIAGDRVPVAAQPRTVTSDFLGAPAAFPAGPYILASILQCPTYLMFSMRVNNRPHVCFELLRESIHLPRTGREQALKPLAMDYAARLQHHCLRAPLQWFNFYDFWHLTKLDKTDASC